MKNLAIVLLSILGLFTTLSAGAADGEKSAFYVIRVRQEIDNAAYAKISKGLSEAQSKGADYCLLDINTYGGAVDAADSIRSAIIQSTLPVIAFINNQAVSAGALICIACDSIYMRKEASIGAATVVNGSGEVMPDKFQSFMRATMRATAESHGKKWVEKDGKRVEVWHRDPHLAEKMVGLDSVLSFTASEAIANGFCEGMAESIDEVIALVSAENGSREVIEQEVSLLDALIYLLMSPYLQGLFLMMIIGGIYFELQSPGIGFPLVIAVVGSILYFAPLYLEGLAENWELILFAVGILLLIVEIFVLPGFGVAGISGIILVIVGLSFAMVNNDLLVVEDSINVRPLLKPLAIVLLSLVISLFGSIALASRLYKSTLFSSIALKTSLESKEGFVAVTADNLTQLIGKEAVVVTDLKPAGMIELDGKQYNAQAEYGYIGKGEKVVIVELKYGVLICGKVL